MSIYSRIKLDLLYFLELSPYTSPMNPNDMSQNQTFPINWGSYPTSTSRSRCRPSIWEFFWATLRAEDSAIASAAERWSSSRAQTKGESKGDPWATGGLTYAHVVLSLFKAMVKRNITWFNKHNLTSARLNSAAGRKRLDTTWFWWSKNQKNNI